ncbi:MAG: DUF924 family protein [Steroidobacteraceae bacterium]|nr:DUF924 family protein [Steroidobacteraceae bacterium]
MHSTNTLLAVTVLATAAAAQGQAYEPPGLVTMETLAERPHLATNSRALDIIRFWRDAGPALWFAKDDAFDRRFRERFLFDHESAARGEYAQWQSTPEGALALILLLDQFPRNAFRGTPRMYDTDAMARKIANTAFAAGYDRSLEKELRKFFVLPLGHSEDLADQERAVALARRIAPDDLAHAEHHRDIVRRFGRFPHRNSILQRASTKEEIDYLATGGYTG